MILQVTGGRMLDGTLMLNRNILERTREESKKNCEGTLEYI